MNSRNMTMVMEVRRQLRDICVKVKHVSRSVLVIELGPLLEEAKNDCPTEFMPEEQKVPGSLECWSG